MGAAMRRSTSDPAPVDHRIGMRPRNITTTVITLGLKRFTAPYSIASLKSAGLFILPLAFHSSNARSILDMIEAARELSQKPHTHWTDQLNNQDSITGYYSLGEEIWSQTKGEIDAFVHSVGTAASLRGVATVLKRYKPSIKIDPAYDCKAAQNGFEVSGNMQLVPSHKLFTPLKNLIFRAVLVLFSWSAAFSHWLKGSIRRTLMLGQRPVPIRFRRKLEIEGNSFVWTNEIALEGDLKVEAMSLGDEFFVRYVPQSRYFQLQELEVRAVPLNAEQIHSLNNHKRVVVKHTISPDGQWLEISA